MNNFDCVVSIYTYKSGDDRLFLKVGALLLMQILA